jgi:hypothetical protein
MNLAFEINDEDIGNALPLQLLSHDEEVYILKVLDFDIIVNSALRSKYMDEQKNYAYQSIKEQFLKKLNSPIYFDVPDMSTTYTAQTLEEAIKAKRMNAVEIPEYVHGRMKELYAAGHTHNNFIADRKN